MINPLIRHYREQVFGLRFSCFTFLFFAGKYDESDNKYFVVGTVVSKTLSNSGKYEITIKFLDNIYSVLTEDTTFKVGVVEATDSLKLEKKYALRDSKVKIIYSSVYTILALTVIVLVFSYFF